MDNVVSVRKRRMWSGVTTKRISKRKYVLPVLLLMLFATVCVFGTDDVFAQKSITLKPGQTYDVGKASKNTSVYINKKGDYTLKGTSRYVRVVICCGGVNCYLDGVNINCGIYSYTGSRASAMNIVNDGGVIKLISKAGTKNYFEGYMAPGIRKEGTKTNLVFETENPKKPGTIEAKGGVDNCGIGCVIYASAAPWYTEPTGNITINSGNIIATGGRQSAGIGGSLNGSLNGLTINGGDVKAYGNGDGAGIGAGYHGRAENITITGGTVYAQSEYGRNSAAAIGGGGGSSKENSDCYGKNITISGGNVTAVSQGGGAAIGGGGDSPGKNITISGGYVKARAEGKTSAGSSAIGAGGGNWRGDASVNITGGYVDAKGGEDTPAIGSGGGTNISHVTVNVNISGGTVIAKKGDKHASNTTHNDKDIGAGFNYNDNVDVRITGGSVYADNVQNAKNSNGDKLHRVNVTCKDIGNRTDIDYYLADAVCTNGYSYGLNDVKLIHLDEEHRTGMFYPWLPNTNERIKTCKLEVQGSEAGSRYGDFNFSASSGNLLAATNIILNPLHPDSADDAGHAVGLPGENKLIIDKMPTIKPKKVILGYAWGGFYEQFIVAEPDGTLKPNTDFTDADGKWTCTDPEKQFSVVTRPFQYTVHYDANIPRSASTKGKFTGNMDDQQFNYDEEEQLTDNGYTLPGYTFDGWNTKADGTGTGYANKAPVMNLTDKDGDVVTLYAQWEPMKYDLTFNPGAISGGPIIRGDYCFDTHSNLPNVQTDWYDPYKSFHCWVDENGNYYDDAEDFINLVQYNSDGTPKTKWSDQRLVGQTLTAQWIDHGIIAATVTFDGKPQAGHEHDFILFSKDDPSIEYSYEKTGLTFEYANGIYTYDSPDDETDPNYLEPGEYYFSFNTFEQGFVPITEEINYQLDSTSSVMFDYYTVSIKKDPVIEAIEAADPNKKIMSVVISGTGLIDPSNPKQMLAPDNAELIIQTNMEENCGYHFDGYSVLGTVPGNRVGTRPYDPSKPNQKITVTGTSAIMSHAEANVYTVHFEGNGGKGLSGHMFDQDMVYDTPQSLYANQFKKIGGTFTGWNTDINGNGQSYDDKESVMNLTTKEGAEVTLYAQWDMEEYNISYDLDEGNLPGDELNPAKYTADDSFTLFNPVRKDHDFLGWIGTDVNVPSTKVTIPVCSTGDRVYIACWQIKHFNVDFVTNGGSEVDQQVVTIHQKAVKPENPTRTGYTFDGWYANKGLTKAFDFNTPIEKDTVLYAKWKALPKLKITFSTGKGSKVASQTVQYNKTAKKPKDPKWTAHIFRGWYADKSLTKTFDFNTKIKKNTTIYAKWTPGILMAKGKATGKRTIKTSWNKVDGASKYLVYGAKCGDKLKRIKVTTKTSFKVKKIKGKKLKKHSPYIFCVVALDKNGDILAISKNFHVIAGKTMGDCANVKKITANKKAITISKGKTVKVGAKLTLPKGKKHLGKAHGKKLHFTSDDPNVASVNKNGVVKAKTKGKATIYIQDTSGIYCTTVVTVK